MDRDMSWHLRKEWRYRERGWLRFLQVWFTDILGILVPGVYFALLFLVWGLGLTALLRPDYTVRFSHQIERALFFSTSGPEATSNGGPTLIGYFVILIGAYIIGYVFYRQSPKLPDSMGFWRAQAGFSRVEACCWVDSPSLAKKGKPSGAQVTDAVRGTAKRHAGLQYLAHIGKTIQDSVVCLFGRVPQDCEEPCRGWLFVPTASSRPLASILQRVLWRPIFELLFLFCPPPRCWQIEFPYRGLRRYLVARRMLRVAELIPWGYQPSSSGHALDDLNRSKHFINRIKEWIHCELPSEYATVARNESHVRLVSSIWYATRAALWLFLAYAVISGIALALGYGRWRDFGLPIIGLFGLGWLKARIERFIHYQRVREIVSILCMAEFMEQEMGKDFWGRSNRATPEELQVEAQALVQALTENDRDRSVPSWLTDLADGK